MATKKRVRTRKVGFIGVSLVRGGDTTLFDRFNKELEDDPELDQSKLVRLALKQYFELRDK